MSRKTRKLIWSVPLVAVLAVVGALAIFAALAPNGAQAQEVMVPGPVTNLDAEVQSRSEIRLTWDAPSSTSGGTATGYRIDHSSDNREWTLLKDNTNSTANRYSITTDVKADTEKYYRVFAINEAGTGPVSVEPVTAYASVPTSFPPTVPGRVALTLTLDGDDPYGKIILNWTEAANNGSAITSYRIVEMINEDRDGGTARMECRENLQIAASTDPVIDAISLVPFEGDPDADDPAPTPLTQGDKYCLLIGTQDVDDPRMAMHAGLTGGESHYYRVIAVNAVAEEGGAPSDTKGITTRTPRKPDAPTEPVAVPIADGIGNTDINLYWLEPVSSGGHALAPFRVQVSARVKLDATPTKWGAYSEWVSLNDEDGTYADAATITAKDGTTDGTVIALMIMEPPDFDEASANADGSIDQLGKPWNLQITDLSDTADAGRYRFQIKAKQSGDGDRGLDLESRWVAFNRPNRAGLSYVTVPVATVDKTEIPLVPTLMAKALSADQVRDQGIGLTWDPNVGVNHDVDDVTTPDPAGTLTPNVPNFSNPDYRIDMSKDGVKWTRGQSRTIALRMWDHEGLKSDDIRYYRLFAINHGRFGEAATAAAQADKAVIASPDQVLNLRQKSATTTSITMEWDAVSAAANYRLYWGEPGENDALPTVWPELDPPTTELTFFTDVGDNLNPGDTRWYRVIALSDDKTPVSGADGAEALGKTEDAGEPGTPVGLVAQEAFDSSLTGSDDRGVLLLWDRPTEAGKDPHTSYTVEWKSSTQTGDAWETLVTDTTNLDNQTPKSTYYHHDSELEANEQRAYRVSALSGSGSGMASNVSYYPPMAGMAELGMPGNTMSLMAGPTDDNDPAAIKLTWEAGANATTHTVAGVLRNADGTFDTSAAIWMTDVSSPLIVEIGDRPAGTYIFGVVAGLIDGTDQEWSDWARATVAYPQ